MPDFHSLPFLPVKHRPIRFCIRWNGLALAKPEHRPTKWTSSTYWAIPNIYQVVLSPTGKDYLTLEFLKRKKGLSKTCASEGMNVGVIFCLIVTWKLKEWNCKPGLQYIASSTRNRPRQTYVKDQVTYALKENLPQEKYKGLLLLGSPSENVYYLVVGSILQWPRTSMHLMSLIWKLVQGQWLKST